MTKVIVDQATLAKFNHSREYAEVYDESGRCLGFVQPNYDPHLYRAVQAPFTNEELDRFEKEPGGRALSDILSDLKNRS